MNSPANAQAAAKIALNLAKACAKLAEVSANPFRARASAAMAMKIAKNAKIAADYAAIATSPEAKAQALADAFQCVSLVKEYSAETQAAALAAGPL